jgi:hypothetical protein
VRKVPKATHVQSLKPRLKLAASMLPFNGYDFEDYLGPRWHCYLGEIIATIPAPLVFAKGQFESGLAAKRLNAFAADSYPFLDEAARKKMNTAQSDLSRKFTELAFDKSADVRWEESGRSEADSVELDSEAASGLQKDLFESPGEPF